MVEMENVKVLLFDLDGTVYCGTDEVPGAAAFVREAQQRGVRCMFVTNRSTRSAEAVREQLHGYGMECEVEDVLTTAVAAARYVGRGSTAYVVGEEGLHEALREAGVEEGTRGVDAVVVSLDRAITYEKLDVAARLIREEGARFVATNTDACLKLEDGLHPGSGTIVGAVATAAGRGPDVILGKPSRALYDQALAQAGVQAGEAIAIGDNVATDIAAGEASGIRTVLILTGISRREDVVAGGPQPTWVVENYAELAKLLWGLPWTGEKVVECGHSERG